VNAGVLVQLVRPDMKTITRKAIHDLVYPDGPKYIGFDSEQFPAKYLEELMQQSSNLKEDHKSSNLKEDHDDPLCHVLQRVLTPLAFTFLVALKAPHVRSRRDDVFPVVNDALELCWAKYTFGAFDAVRFTRPEKVVSQFWVSDHSSPSQINQLNSQSEVQMVRAARQFFLEPEVVPLDEAIANAVAVHNDVSQRDASDASNVNNVSKDGVCKVSQGDATDDHTFADVSKRDVRNVVKVSKRDIINLADNCRYCGKLSHSTDNCQDVGNFQFCPYPHHCSIYPSHSIRTCPTLHAFCNTCHVRGHKSVSHEQRSIKASAGELRREFRKFASFGVGTSPIFIRNNFRSRSGFYGSTRDRGLADSLIAGHKDPFDPEEMAAVKNIKEKFAKDEKELYKDYLDLGFLDI